MYLSYEKVKDILVITLQGELDHHSAEEVRVKIDDRIDRDDIKKLILNFNGVTFMDSSGIGVVVGRLKKMQSKKGELCISDVNKTVNKVFELSGLYKIIKAYDSVAQAIVSI